MKKTFCIYKNDLVFWKVLIRSLQFPVRLVFPGLSNNISRSDTKVTLAVPKVFLCVSFEINNLARGVSKVAPGRVRVEDAKLVR